MPIARANYLTNFDGSVALRTILRKPLKNCQSLWTRHARKNIAQTPSRGRVIDGVRTLRGPCAFLGGEDLAPRRGKGESKEIREMSPHCGLTSRRVGESRRKNRGKTMAVFGS
jgi:hypothetical protein